MSKSGFAVRVYKQYFNFASAHFIIFADGTREELHGHNYQVRVSVEGELDAADIVLDFSKLKPIVKQVCDSLDHRCLFPAAHPKLLVSKRDDHYELVYDGRERFVLPARDVVLLPIHNTSTERLAEWFSAEILRRVRAVVPTANLAHLEVEVEESTGQCGVYATDL